MVKVNTKYLIQNLLYGKSDEKLCFICCDNQNELRDMEEGNYIGPAGESNTLSSILKYIANYEFTLDGAINIKICQKCEKSALESYIFVKQYEASIKVIERCVDYMSEYVKKIDCEKLGHSVERENLLLILPEEITQDSYKSNPKCSIVNSKKELEKPSNYEKNDSDFAYIKLTEIKEEFLTQIGCETINLTQDQLFNYIENRHEKNENSESAFICDYCSNLFETKDELVVHIESEHQMFDKCLLKYKSHQSVERRKKKQLRNSSSKYRQGEKPPLKLYNCSMCAESFANLSLLKEHKYKHPGGTMHICRDCGRMYKTVMALRQHCFVHKIKTKNYLCQVCGKAFLKKSMLNAHAKSHDAKIHKCPYCDVRCQNENKVAYHIKQVHQKEYNHMCDVCGKLFASSGELGIHRDRHVIKNCSLCGKGYKDQKQYKFHMQKHETASVKYMEKKYECDYCGGWWKHKWSLVQHIYGKHLYNRPYKCGICQKGFYTKSAQSRHNIVHTKERPEVCTICQNRFVDKRALLFHTRIHTGEKPYKCSECGIKFLNASRRLAHMKSKHLEPKEECHVCHKKFAWRKTLKKHLEKHNKNDENDDVYPNQFYLSYLEP